MMELRALGQTGLRVSAIGLGTVALGRAEGLKLARPARVPDDDEAVELLRTARELGINLIDTAPAYGSSEERLGVILPRVAPRADWVICTKVGEEFDTGSAESHYDFSARSITASVEGSLQRLRVDAIDVVLLHFSSKVDDAAILEAGEALGALRHAQSLGKVRLVGASTSTVRGGLLAVERGCDVVMVTLNSTQREDLVVVEAARARGAGVLVKKALGSGHLDAAGSLRWVLAQPGVSSALVGTTSTAHLRENAAALSS
jgi:aryl-alcohol dehydrogenase-like predicted oxidoreductase